MYGAILGDIIGSPYEFDRGDKTKDFPLFSKESQFTDDTVMTIAVADALLQAKDAGLLDHLEDVPNEISGESNVDDSAFTGRGPTVIMIPPKKMDFSTLIGSIKKPADKPSSDDNSETTDNLNDSVEGKIKWLIIRALKNWGSKYPTAGYGWRFYRWVSSNNTKPYGSYGNGSAMRVSSAGWLLDSLDDTRKVARLTAEVTHNHPEGIKGAESTAAAIYLARNGASKEEIKDYIVREFGYDLSRSIDEIRPGYKHVESCQQSVPEAITAFLEGEDFEDVIRTAVSLGGDTDTIACIAGSIAEAFYGVPANLKAECLSRIPEDMQHVVRRRDDELMFKAQPEKNGYKPPATLIIEC